MNPRRWGAMAVAAMLAWPAGAGDVTVIKAGFGGHNVKALAQHLDVAVLAKSPTLVVLLVGTNDGINSGALTPPDEFRRAFAALCDRILATHCTLLAMTPPPFHEPDLMTRHKREAYGELPPARRLEAIRTAIREVAAERKVPVVDLEKAFAVAGGVGEAAASPLRNQANSGVRDGVHPTPAGYRIIADGVAAAIRANRLPILRIVCFGDSITLGAGAKDPGDGSDASYPAQLQRLLTAREREAGQPSVQPSR